jgi:hypothetical protein
MRQPTEKVISTHYVVEAAINASHGDGNMPWVRSMPRNIATWGEIADTRRPREGK